METDDVDLSRSDVFSLWREAGRVVDVRVDGISMLPLLRPGDTISLRLVNGFQLKTGDLLAFRQNGKLIVHRFIRRRMISGSCCAYQIGDNLTIGSWIDLDEVLGRVESIRRCNRLLKMNSRTWICVNRAMGVSGTFWVSVVEKAKALKLYVGMERNLPLAGGFFRCLGKVLNKVSGFIVLQVIENGGGKA